MTSEINKMQHSLDMACNHNEELIKQNTEAKQLIKEIVEWRAAEHLLQPNFLERCNKLLGT